MKNLKKLFAAVLALSMAVSICACGSKTENSASQDSTVTDVPAYSEGLDDNGFVKDLKASDCVELCNYIGLEIPESSAEVSPDVIQSYIDQLLSYYADTVQVTDRAVADGDSVNIDYVGSIDGVEFDGGNTGGQGTTVIIGYTSYIDDFLDQLIGHKPGETFDVEVTFPDDYPQNEDLAGKDAVFKTTINYIQESVDPELTDDFVKENLYDLYGVSTIAELTEYERVSIRNSQISSYLNSYLLENCEIKSTPTSVINYESDILIYYYENYAANYGMDLDSMLQSMGYSDRSQLITANETLITQSVNNLLIYQAIAETEGLSVEDEDVESFLGCTLDSDTYQTYVEYYGAPYLKNAALPDVVMDFIISNSVIPE